MNEATNYRPTPGIENALCGEVSRPQLVTSQKPGSEGQTVEVSLVTTGSGQFGLTSWRDNKEWAGIFNHSVLTARIASHLAMQLAKREHPVDPQLIIDTMIVSHPGRRQWDEARWYPDAAPNAAERTKVTNETLGLRIIQGHVPEKAFKIVTALAHGNKEFPPDPDTLASLEYRLTSYVDHRTTDHVQALHTRMGDFLAGYFFARNSLTADEKTAIYDAMKTIISRKKQGEKVTVEEADAIAARLGANETSDRLDRKDFMHLVLQDAEIEILLEENGIDVTAINESTVPMPQWEEDLRRRS